MRLPKKYHKIKTIYLSHSPVNPKKWKSVTYKQYKWDLLKKSYPWRQESRVNHNGTAGHSVPRYYTTYERWAASLPNNQIKKDESLRNFHWCLIRTLHNYPFLADWKSINYFPLNELAGRQHKKLDLISWYFSGIPYDFSLLVWYAEYKKERQNTMLTCYGCRTQAWTGLRVP